MGVLGRHEGVHQLVTAPVQSQCRLRREESCRLAFRPFAQRLGPEPLDEPDDDAGRGLARSPGRRGARGVGGSRLGCGISGHAGSLSSSLTVTISVPCGKSKSRKNGTPSMSAIICPCASEIDRRPATKWLIRYLETPLLDAIQESWRPWLSITFLRCGRAIARPCCICFMERF